MSARTNPPAREEIRFDTDQQMLEFLKDRLAEKYKEGGGTRHYADAIIARFAELIEERSTFRRAISTIEDAHKLAMAQMQFAQTVVRQLERQVDSLEKISHQGNGKSAPPALELKGK